MKDARGPALPAAVAAASPTTPPAASAEQWPEGADSTTLPPTASVHAVLRTMADLLIPVLFYQ